MKILKKRDLPIAAVIPGINFDLTKLRGDVDKLSERWTNVFQANRGLCAAHETLATDNYHHFDQINLTYFEESLNEFVSIDELRQECKVIANSDQLGETKTQRYRTRINRTEDLPPAMNEHNWHHPLECYKDTYIKQAIESQFKSTPIRVRLTRIRAGQYLTPHIDYDPSYAVRIIVPISGTFGVDNLFWVGKEKKVVNMVADGSAYFINTGYMHSVEHNGPEDRVVLMFSLPTQEDIQSIAL